MERLVGRVGREGLRVNLLVDVVDSGGWVDGLVDRWELTVHDISRFNIHTPESLKVQYSFFRGRILTLTSD